MQTDMADTPRALVIVHASDDSLHERWTRTVKNFDLAVLYAGESSGRFEEKADYYQATSKPKWPAVAEFVAAHHERLRQYDALWVPDDDIECDSCTIEKMFQIFSQYGLWLAQPALARGTHITYPVTERVQLCVLRYVDFIDIRCPMFSYSSFVALSGTFELSQSGWGLDFLWPYFLNYPKQRMAIIDATPIAHTCGQQSERFFSACRRRGIDPHAEFEALTSRFGLKWRREIVVHSHALAESLPPVRPKPREASREKFPCDGLGPAFCINLRRRPERWASFQVRAIDAGVVGIQRFEAVDGKTLHIPDSIATHRGTYGCLHSHAGVFRLALECDSDYAFVFEDDCVFTDQVSRLNEYFCAARGAFHYIHFGGGDQDSKWGVVHRVGLCEVAGIYNLHAYAVHRDLMIQYISTIEQNPYPTDEFLHADRLLLRLCHRRGFKVCIPPSPMAWQNRALPRDVPWGVPRL